MYNSSFIQSIGKITGFKPQVTKEGELLSVKISRWRILMTKDSIDEEPHYLAERYSQLLPTQKIIIHLYNELTSNPYLVRKKDARIDFTKVKFECEEFNDTLKVWCLIFGERVGTPLIIESVLYENYNLYYTANHMPLLWITKILADTWFDQILDIK